MRETAFIQQNEQKWREFEQILEGERRDPGKLNDLFIQVTDDLSYARTFYPNRSVRVYLNGLAQRIFFKIYKGKKSKRSRFAEFWKDDLPLLLYQARPDLMLSLVVFVLAMAIGVLSCYADPDFLQVILGDDYVEMTRENIESGDPMAVYKQRGEVNIFLGITLHNLTVALQTFLFGVFYAIGTIGSLLYNGIMLGAFQYFFIDQGLFVESFLTVWMHGAFEISSIVIAGAAGITMGRGLVFPGTLSRMRSFQLAARRGLSIMVGVVPLFIVAGFIESFLTRYTDMPNPLRALFIFLCFGLVIFYFVIFPAMRVKKGMARTLREIGLSPDVNHEIDLTSVKNTGELFTDTFIFYRKKFKPIALVSAACALIFTAGAYLLAEVEVLELFGFTGGFFGTFEVLPSFFVNDYNPWLFALNTVSMTAVAFTVHRLVALHQENNSLSEETKARSTWKHVLDFFKVLVVAVLFNLIIMINMWFVIFIIVLVFQVLFLWSQVMLSENRGLVDGLSRSFQLTGGTYAQMLGLLLTLMICGTLFFLILDTGILSFLLSYISMNFFMTEAQGEIFTTVLITFVSMFVLLLIFGLWVTGSGLQYFSNLEVVEANALKERVSQIQTRKRIRGLERES